MSVTDKQSGPNPAQSQKSIQTAGFQGEPTETLGDEQASSDGFDAMLGGALQQVHGEYATDEAELPSMSGRTVDDFIVDQLVGRGGFGQAYKAYYHGPEKEELKHGGSYVLKFSSAQQGNASIHKEVSQLSRIRHDKVVAYRGSGRLPSVDRPNLGYDYVVLDYVEEAKTLTDYCDQQQLTVRERLELFQQVCEGVSFLHNALIAHRDLKPTNILVDKHGTVKIVDFGAARFYEPAELDGTVNATRTLNPTRTPAYCSPEQLSGQPETTATDIYALGVILYQLLTGHMPYELDGSPTITQDRIVNRAPEHMSARLIRASGESRLYQERKTTKDKLIRALNGELNSIVTKALEKKASRRYPSPSALGHDLENMLCHRPVTAHNLTSRFYRMGKALRRSWLPIALLSTLLLIALGWVATLRERNRVLQNEQALAQASRDFLVNLFAGNNPTRTPGEEPNLDTVLSEGREHALDGLADQPELRLSILDSLTEIHDNAGYYQHALSLAQEALAQHQKLEILTASQQMSRHFTQCQLHYNLGEYFRAEACLERAAQLTSTGKLVPGQRAAIYFGRANLFLLMGDPDRAEHFLARAFAAIIPGDLNAEINILESQAFAALYQGEARRAEAKVEQALSRLHQAERKHTPQEASLLGILGSAQLQLRREEAEDTLQRALGLMTFHYGEEHPILIDPLNALAVVALLRADRTESSRILARAKDIAGKVDTIGALSTAALASHLNLGTREPGKAAMDLHRQLTRLERQPLRTPITRFNEAFWYFTQGKLVKAKQILHQQISELSKIREEDDPVFLLAQSLLGTTLMQLKEPELAEEVLLCVLIGEQAQRTPDLEPLMTAQLQLGLLYNQRGESGKANNHLAAARSLAKQLPQATKEHMQAFLSQGGPIVDNIYQMLEGTEMRPSPEMVDLFKTVLPLVSGQSLMKLMMETPAALKAIAEDWANAKNLDQATAEALIERLKSTDDFRKAVTVQFRGLLEQKDRDQADAEAGRIIQNSPEINRIYFEMTGRKLQKTNR